MKDIIATWICIDDKKDGTYFPSSKGNSGDTAVQEIYWRCVCTFFWCARFQNPSASLVLFSNVENLPVIESTSIKAILKKLDVTFYTTDFEFIPPAGYYGEWRNQFYEFSIFKFVATHEDFKDDDRFLLLDSDCIITSNLQPLFAAIQKDKCITYLIDYVVDANINGNSRKDMKSIFEGLTGKKMDYFPNYHGGEFYASTIKVLKKILEDFYTTWPLLLIRNDVGLPKLNEEAHVLSYLFFLNDIKGGNANQFVKRLWTDPSRFRNVVAADRDLLIWHLPAHKRDGFKKLFHILQQQNFDLEVYDAKTLQQKLSRLFYVPDIPIEHKPYYAAKLLVRKLLN